jgi:hypothetical protein
MQVKLLHIPQNIQQKNDIFKNIRVLSKNLGHKLRKDDEEPSKASFQWNPEGKRVRGRPRNSWRRSTLIEAGRSWSKLRYLVAVWDKWKQIVDDLCSWWNYRIYHHHHHHHHRHSRAYLFTSRKQTKNVNKLDPLQLTPRRRLLLEKLRVAKLFKKLQAFYIIGRFLTVFTTACLSQMNPVHDVL